MQSQTSQDHANINDLIKNKQYHKMLPRRKTKIVKEMFFRFTDYLFIMALSLNIPVNVCQYLYVIHNLFSSFIPMSNTIWPQKTLLGYVVNIASVFAFLSPIQASKVVYYIIQFIDMASATIAATLFFSFLIYFFKKSSLPKPIIWILTLCLNGLVPLWTQWGFAFLARNICILIEGFDFIAVAASVFLIVILIIPFFLQYCLISSQLLIRPQSIPLTNSNYAIAFFAYISLRTVLLILSCNVTLNVGIVLQCAALLVTFILLYISFKTIHWATPKNMLLSRSYLIVSQIVLFVLIFFNSLGIRGNEIIIILSLFLFLILNITCNIFYKREISKCMSKLDDIQESDLPFNGQKLDDSLKLLQIGFYNGHPIVHSRFLFDKAFEEFGDEKTLVTIFARFSSIYQDDTHNLIVVAKKLHKIKKGNIETKHVLSQMLSTLQQRENKLSPDLKKKLRKINEKMIKVKSQIRYIWECIIRGSISEIESCAASLIKNEDDAIAELSQLSIVYPNNPYVALDFSRFHSDITCDLAQANSYMMSYSNLRKGARTRMERGYAFASLQIEQLPDEYEHTKFTNHENHDDAINNIEGIRQDYSLVSSFMGHQEIQGNTKDENLKELSYLDNLIGSVDLPSSKIAPILITFICCIMTQVMCIPFLIIFSNNVNTNIQSNDTCILASRLCDSLISVSIYAMQYSLSVSGIVPSLSDRYIDLMETPMDYQMDGITILIFLQNSFWIRVNASIN